MVFNVRINVWIMTLLFIAGVLYFLLARSRGLREDPATFPGVRDLDGPTESTADEPETEPAEEKEENEEAEEKAEQDDEVKATDGSTSP